MPSHAHRYSVLYVGRSYELLSNLQERLLDLGCHVVRCPANGVLAARSFIRSDIPYTLFLFDEILAGATGEELARFALSLEHRAGTPTLILKESDDVPALVEIFTQLLRTEARAECLCPKLPDKWSPLEVL